MIVERFDAERFLAWALPLSSALGVTTALIHPFHPGIDLPMHAYVISALEGVIRGDPSYEAVYEIAPFTPYLAVYLATVPLVPLLGAFGAVKALIAVAAAVTPWAMTEWLRAIGGEPILGVLGGLLVFAFPYQWGFLSQIAAIPILFLYLAAVEQQGEAPSPRAAAKPLALAFLLLACHGISFGVAVLIAGSRALFPFRPGAIAARLLHLVPVLLGAALWLGGTREGAAAVFGVWPPVTTRLIWLFSGPFRPEASPEWAKLGLSVLAVSIVLGHPRLGGGATRWIPVTWALVLYAVLPEWVLSTWLVGTRCLAYAHAFFPGIFAPSSVPGRRLRLSGVTLGVTAMGFGLLNVRLARFNEEVAGLSRLAERVPRGTDVRTALPTPESGSQVFGMAQHRYAGAYLAIQDGGLLLEDFSTALQMPLRRRAAFPFPTEFRALVDRGDPEAARARARALTRGAELVAREGPWLLFMAPERHLARGALSIERWSQGWGQPESDRSVTGARLEVAGASYASGVGVHAPSFIQVRLPSAGRLSGAAGVDAGAWDSARLLFKARTNSGRVLFESPPLTRSDRAVPFDFRVAKEEGLVLEVSLASRFEGAHADWLELTFSGEAAR